METAPLLESQVVEWQISKSGRYEASVLDFFMMVVSCTAFSPDVEESSSGEGDLSIISKMTSLHVDDI